MCLSKKGYASLAFDISLGSHFDFLMPCIHKLIKGWITSGCIGGVILPFSVVLGLEHVMGLLALAGGPSVTISTCMAFLVYLIEIKIKSI